MCKLQRSPTWSARACARGWRSPQKVSSTNLTHLHRILSDKPLARQRGIEPALRDLGCWGHHNPARICGNSAEMSKLQRRPTWSAPRSSTGLAPKPRITRVGRSRQKVFSTDSTHLHRILSGKTLAQRQHRRRHPLSAQDLWLWPVQAKHQVERPRRWRRQPVCMQ